MIVKNPSLHEILAAFQWCVTRTEPSDNTGSYESGLYLPKATYKLGVGAWQDGKYLSRRIDKYECVGWGSWQGDLSKWDKSLREGIFHYSVGHGWRTRKEPRVFKHVPLWATTFDRRFGINHIHLKNEALIYLLDDRWYEFPFLEYQLVPFTCVVPRRIDMKCWRGHMTLRVDYKDTGCDDIPF